MTRSTFIVCLLLAVFSLLMIVWQPVSWTEIWAGLLIVWISSLPMLLYQQGIDRTPIPFLPAVGAYYLVFYGLPVFAKPLAYRKGDHVVLYEHVVLGALSWDMVLLLAVGIGALFGGFFLAKQSVFASMPRFRLPDPDPCSAVLNFCYWILMAVSLAYRLIPWLSELPSIGQFLNPAGYLALGGFFLQWHRGSLPRWQLAPILLIVVPLDLYERVRYLFITDFIFLGMFFGFVLWRCNRFRALAIIIVFGASIIATYSATTAYRNAGDTLFAKIRFSVDGALQVLGGGLTTQGVIGEDHQIEKMSTAVGLITFDPRISPLINRIGHIWTFQTVFERTPDPVPYWRGQTYGPLLTAVIPRIFYPDKPEERAGADFGVRYGFTEADVNHTSFNIPWIVELLANFGELGVVVGMAIFGIFLAFLDKIFNSAEASDSEFLVGLTAIFNLSYQESNFSVMIGSLPMLVLALYLYFAVGTKILRMWLTQCSANV